MEFGFIYRVTCKITGKQYIGQAREFKHKNGKPFCYGIKGRWNDHLSSAKREVTTPIAEAIRQYGALGFEVSEVQKAPLEELDALETHWIQSANTVVPNGYNVCAHSRNRHRTSSSLAKHYIGRVESAILRPVRRNEQYKLVYAVLTLKDGGSERIVFGQSKAISFKVAKEQAHAFLEQLKCPFVEETSNSEDPLERYATKINRLAKKDIKRIRITSASNLVAVYVTTSDAKSYKDQIRICFGGKDISHEKAHELAQLFVNALPKSEHTILEDIYQSPQQVAAPMVETEP